MPIPKYVPIFFGHFAFKLNKKANILQAFTHSNFRLDPKNIVKIQSVNNYNFMILSEPIYFSKEIDARKIPIRHVEKRLREKGIFFTTLTPNTKNWSECKVDPELCIATNSFFKLYN